MSAAPDIAGAPLCVAAQLWLVEYLLTRESLVRGTKVDERGNTVPRRVPVIGRRETNIQSDIDQAINELGGACIYVVPMLPLKFNVNLPGPFIDLAEIRIRCIENDTLNTALPSVYELVEAVVRDVCNLTLGTLPLSQLAPAEPRPVEPVYDTERLIQDVIFHVNGSYAPRIEEQ
jgi:hypothetical protein